MAIDVFSERVITFKEAISLLPKPPRSNKLHISTLYRWSLSGLAEQRPSGGAIRGRESRRLDLYESGSAPTFL